MWSSWWWFQFPDDVLWWVSCFNYHFSKLSTMLSLCHLQCASKCNFKNLFFLFEDTQESNDVANDALHRSFNRCVLMNLILLNITHFDPEWKMMQKNWVETERRWKLNLLFVVGSEDDKMRGRWNQFNFSVSLLFSRVNNHYIVLVV